MGFLKAQWQLIVIGLISAASLTAGAWAIVAGASVEGQLKEIDGLVSKVAGYQKNAANARTIEAKKQELEEQKTDFEHSLQKALAMQKNNAFYEQVDNDGNVIPSPRQTLVPDVLPEPRRNADAILFRDRYLEECGKLAEKLHGRPAPTKEEIANEEARIQTLGKESRAETSHSWWGSAASAAQALGGEDKGKKDLSLPEFLRQYPAARAAEQVATSIYMYVNENTFGKPWHPDPGGQPPNAVEIWQAQMSLWIQQDIAAALARCNEERAIELKQRGEQDKLWVAYMPIKHLKLISILGVLGRGGGSNTAGIKWPESFTGAKNDDKKFVVPIQLQLIVEEASVMKVLGYICSAGFYTPTSISYRAVPPNPLCEEYLYGDEPVVDLVVDLEAYYFQAVFKEWIPKELEKILRTPGAVDEESRSGRG
jgi:hypothetical protein